MDEAEYPLVPLEGEDAADEAGPATRLLPGNPRLLLVALVLSVLSLPVLVFDNLPGPAEAEELQAADPDGTAVVATTVTAPAAKQVGTVTDREERLEAAYEATMAERRAAADAAAAEAEAEADDDADEEAAPSAAADDDADEPAAPPSTEAPTTTAPPTTAAPAPAPAGPVGDVWGALAQCESGGNWAHQGSYHGGLQFHPSTWVAYGGTQYAPYAYQASAAQQIAVAERIVAASGGSYRAWPGCRARLGLP